MAGLPCAGRQVTSLFMCGNGLGAAPGHEGSTAAQDGSRNPHMSETVCGRSEPASRPDVLNSAAFTPRGKSGNREAAATWALHRDGSWLPSMGARSASAP